MSEFLNPALLTNFHIDSYVKSQLRMLHTCPICDIQLSTHIAVINHVESTHRDEIDDDITDILYNPVKRLRSLEVMQRIKNPTLMSIGEFFGRIILSKHNQNAIVTVTGPTGSGKSNASLEICDCYAEYAANRTGRPKTDFFSMDNVAVMEMDAIAEIVGNLGKNKHKAIILDDAGTAWNSRNSQSKGNKELNKIVTTFRDSNCLLIINTVSDFMIDKYGRRLTHFTIEMTRSYHNYNTTIGKLKRVRENAQEHKMYYQFPVIDGVTYNRIAFNRANKELADAYEKRRSEVTKKIKAESSKNMRSSAGEPIREKKEPVYMTIIPQVNAILIEHPNATVRSIAKNLGVSNDAAMKAKNYIMTGSA